MSKALIIAIAVVALVGFIDATYLTVEHYSGGTPSCSVLTGCVEVTTSEYATIFSIPVALLGSINYLLILLAAIFYLDRKGERTLQFLSLYPIAGLFASAYFVYLMFFVIGDVCIYCLGSATTSTILFILAMILLRQRRKRTKPTIL